MTQPPEVVVAMDWGGTWVRVAVIGRLGEILWQSRVANAPGGDKDRLLRDAQEVLVKAISWCDLRPVVGVGVAVAGPVDAETGTLYDPPNLPALNGVSLKAYWESALGHRVWVGNDANLAALGEYRYGAGRPDGIGGEPPETLVYLTVSTGIGGGVVSGGQVFLGAHGLAAEIGHMVIDWRADAPQCQCGNRGCLEALASGTAIAKIARARVADAQSLILTLASGEAESITSETVFRAASQGDTLAQSIVEDVVQALAVGLTNVLHLYNPDLVVLGGGVTLGLDGLGLLPRIHSVMVRSAMSQRHKDFRLVASQLGDAAGMLGAASMVWEGVGVT
jgi:glucokinase